MAQTHRELTAWQKAFALCIEVYRVTRKFPRVEAHGLSAQMQRAAVSTPSNIAEGFGRRTTPDFLHSLYIAYGSVCELETQVRIAAELDYIPDDETQRLLQSTGDVERLTKAFIRSLEKRRATPARQST
jgi:four helix bundle protein